MWSQETWVHMMAFREEIVIISGFKGKEGTIWGKGSLHMVFIENQSKHIQRQQITGGRTHKQNGFLKDEFQVLKYISGFCPVQETRI